MNKCHWSDDGCCALRVSGRKARTQRRAAAIVAGAASLAASSMLCGQTVNSTWTDASGTHTWSNPLNWMAPVVPNNTGTIHYDVTLGAPATTVLDTTVTIDTLTVQSTGSLGILDAQTLTIAGGTMTNSSVVTINSNGQGDATSLAFSADAMLSGTGSVVLNASANVSSRSQLNTTGGATLTQAAGHTISGDGQINAALVNNGLVNSNVNNTDLFLQTNNMTNNSVFKASGGGRLDISGITVTQGAAGQVTADGGAVQLSAASITGGTLNSLNGGVISATSGSNTLTSVTNNSTFNQVDNTFVHLANSLVDNGSMTINSNGQGDATAMVADNNVQLSGTGTITLNASADVSLRAQLNSAAGAVITQAAGHTINGDGQINAALNNQGTINANINTFDLVLQTSNMTNTGTMEATSGGRLDINGIAVTNTGGLITANGSTLHIGNGATITGGTLSSSNGGAIFTDLGGSTTLSGNLTLPTGTQYNIVDNTNTHLGSSITNNGSITINSNGQGDATSLVADSSATLGGSGTLTLNATFNVSPRAQLNSAAGAVLTQAAGHTINGDGQINAALNNQGTVNANVNGSDLSLQTSNMTNTGTMEATNGGRLDINGITVTNTGGTISAAAGSAIQLTNATISGGTLATGGTGAVQTIGGTSSLVVVTNNGTLNVLDNAPLNVSGASLANNGTITVNANSGGDSTALTFAAGTLLTGTGSLAANQNGHVLFPHNASHLTHTVGSVATSGNGSVDLANNNLDIHYGGASPDSSVRMMLLSGYNGGAWNGPGINSSDAAANHYFALGYADGADGVVSGLHPGDELIKFAPAGDINLDGTVNFSDVLRLIQNYGRPNARWDMGDLNYDGTVNFSDVLILIQNYGHGLSSVASFAQVPEPAALSLLITAPLLLRRTRRAR